MIYSSSDGINGNIAEYWELMFVPDTSCSKEEVLDEPVDPQDWEGPIFFSAMTLLDVQDFSRGKSQTDKPISHGSSINSFYREPRSGSGNVVQGGSVFGRPDEAAYRVGISTGRQTTENKVKIVA